jgi:hypothetical protein
MKLSDDQFKKVCEIISQNVFKYMKRKIQREFNILSNGNTKLIDVNTIINIVITSLAILDGNIINTCRNVYKAIYDSDIDMKKLLALREHVINQVLEKYLCKETLN